MPPPPSPSLHHHPLAPPTQATVVLFPHLPRHPPCVRHHQRPPRPAAQLWGHFPVGGRSVGGGAGRGGGAARVGGVSCGTGCGAQAAGGGCGVCAESLLRLHVGDGRIVAQRGAMGCVQGVMGCVEGMMHVCRYIDFSFKPPNLLVNTPTS